MVNRVTNSTLTELLAQLGFRRGQAAASNQCVWRHPESGCTLLLPANKAAEAPRPADLVGLRAQLDLCGHLDGPAFDTFLAEGHLPAASAAE